MGKPVFWLDTNPVQIRITAHDAASNAGYSYSGTFTTADLAPPTVSLISPTNGATLTGNSPVSVVWNATDNVAVTNVYLEFSLNGGASWLALTNDPGNSGKFAWTVPNTPTTAFLLRATAEDSSGLTTSATSGQALTIVQANNPPITPHSPFPLASGINISPAATILQWQSGDLDGDALSYQVCLGTNGTPPSITTVQQSTFSPGFLRPQTTYFWQILASDGKATTPGPVWSFTTQTGPLPQAMLSAASIGTNAAFQFQFEGIFGATYAVQCSSNLTTWTTITNLTVTENQILFSDMPASNTEARFYRLLLQ